MALETRLSSASRRRSASPQRNSSSGPSQTKVWPLASASGRSASQTSRARPARSTGSRRRLMSRASFIASAMRLSIMVVSPFALVRTCCTCARICSRSPCMSIRSDSISARPRITASGFFQIVRDRAEDLGLEAVGAPQVRALQVQPAVRPDQLRGPLDDPPLQVGVGLLQPLVEDDVVERDRQPAREQGDERPVRLGELAVGLDQRDDLAAARRVQVQGRPVLAEAVAALGEGPLNEGLHPLLQRPGRLAPGIVAVAAGPGQDAEALLRGGGLAQDQDPRAGDVQERGDLGEDTLGQALHRFVIEEHRRRVDDDLEPAPGLVEALQLLVGAQGRGRGWWNSLSAVSSVFAL